MLSRGTEQTSHTHKAKHTGGTHGQSSSLPAILPGIPCFRSHHRCNVPACHHGDGSNRNTPRRGNPRRRKRDRSTGARSVRRNEHPETNLPRLPGVSVWLND